MFAECVFPTTSISRGRPIEWEIVVFRIAFSHRAGLHCRSDAPDGRSALCVRRRAKPAECESPAGACRSADAPGVCSGRGWSERGSGTALPDNSSPRRRPATP